MRLTVMKAKKVHVKSKKMYDVICELERAGVKNLNVIEIPAVDYLTDSKALLHSGDYGKKHFSS